MTDARSAPRKSLLRRVLRRGWRWAWRGSLIGLLVLVLLYVTREGTLHPLLVRAAPWVVARVGPYELALDDIDGDWFSDLSVSGVRFAEYGPGAVVEHLSLERASVRGGVFGLALGDLTGPDEVRVEGLDLVIDARPRALPVASEPASGGLPALGDWPRVSLQRGRVTVRTEIGDVVADGLRLDTDTQPRPWAEGSLVRGWKLVSDLSLPAVSTEVERAGLTGAHLALDAALLLDRLVLRADVAVEGRGQVHGEGTLTPPVGARRMGAVPSDELATAPFVGTLRADLADLGWIAQLDPLLRRVEGGLSLQVDLTGKLAALEPRGRVTLLGGRVRAEGLPGLDEVELDLIVTPALVEIRKATASLGASPLRLTGSAGLRPPFVLNARITGENALLARTSDVRLRADVDLAMQGPLATPNVTGSVALVGSRARLEVDLLGALEGALPRKGGGGSSAAVRTEGLPIPALGPAGGKLDVALTTSEPVRVQGNVARGALRADLRLTGDTAAPVLVGQVFVDPLELALPAATVRYESGAVRFTPDRPNVPQLELYGETRVAGFDVQVNLSGPYDEPVVRLSSTPPLGADQLLLLVVSGRPPTEAKQLSSAGEALAVYIAKDLVRSWFDDGGFDDRQSFLNRIEVVTGRNVSKSGVLTVEATYLVRERLVGREGGAYAVLERDAYEDYNLGLRFVVRLK